MKKVLNVIVILVACLPLAANAQHAYHVVNTFHIASAGKWDYIAVNPITDNIYVSHATQVNILNKKGDSVDVIANTKGVHGIAFAPAFDKGFITDGALNNVAVFDIKTNKVLVHIPTGKKPDAIFYDAYSKKIFVGDGHSAELTVINPANDKVVATIALGGKPETAVSDNAGHVFVNLEDKSEILKVNAKTYKVEARWSLEKGEAPTGLAIDAKTKRLFAGCDNKLLVVMNATDGKIITYLPIGEGCDGVAFDPKLKHVYAAAGEGVLNVYKEAAADKYELVQNVKTKKGARTLTVDEKDHLVYLPTADLVPSANKLSHHADMVPGTFQVLVVGH